MADLRVVSARARRLLNRYRRLVSALLAGVAVLVVAETVAPPPQDSRPVVVAARDLEAGSALSAADLGVVQMPARLVPTASASTRSPLVGHVLAGPMRAGEVVTDRRIVGGALLAGYPRGVVAAPVRVGDASVVSLLQVGDRLDVYAARSDSAAADLVVTDVPVVALPRSDEGAQPGRLVVLAVTSRQAAALAGAAATAPLSLAMRR